MVVLAVAARGADGWAFTVTAVADEIQVGSDVVLTKIMWEPAAIPAKVTEA